MMDIGRICVKTAGREAGNICCIVKKVDASFVLVTGPREITKVKRRKCNIVHLEPLEHQIKIAEDADDQAVIKAYQTADLFKKLNLHVPSKQEVKALEELKAQKAKEKAAREEKAKKEREKAEKEAAAKKAAEAKKAEEAKKKAAAKEKPAKTDPTKAEKPAAAKEAPKKEEKPAEPAKTEPATDKK